MRISRQKSTVFALFFYTSLLMGCGQKKPLPYNYRQRNEDSICKFGRKYARPERTGIQFPAKQVTNKYKIVEIHRAIPDSLSSESRDRKWCYDYYFVDKITDYDAKTRSTFTPKGDKLLYKLKDTYFFDINGDGLLDFIHYPKYYRAIMLDGDRYELFLQIANVGYKSVSFQGFITEIVFNSDGTINKMKTFRDRCCDDNHTFFYDYIFDRKTNDLVLTNSDTVLTCQFVKESR